MAVETPERVDTEPAGWVPSRIEARHARRAQRRAARGASWPGGVGLSIGGGRVLLQNAGFIVPGQQVWGGLCYLLALGAAATALARYRAADSRFTTTVSSATSGAVLLAFVGTMLFFDLSWGVLWPMLLIIPGVMAVIGSVASGERTDA